MQSLQQAVFRRQFRIYELLQCYCLIFICAYLYFFIFCNLSGEFRVRLISRVTDEFYPKK